METTSPSIESPESSTVQPRWKLQAEGTIWLPPGWISLGLTEIKSRALYRSLVLHSQHRNSQHLHAQHGCLDGVLMCTLGIGWNVIGLTNLAVSPPPLGWKGIINIYQE